MRRNKVRLTESQLHQVIKESVNKILNETSNRYYLDDLDNDFNGDIDKQKQYAWDLYNNRDGYLDGYADEDGRPFFIKMKYDNTDYDDDYKRDIYNAYRDRFGKKAWFYANNGRGAQTALDDLKFIDGNRKVRPEKNSDEYLDYSDMRKGIDNIHRDKYHNEFEKRQASKERDKTNRALKAADSRPLHRKGSLNRALDESKLHKIINDTIRRTLDKGF